MVKKIFLIVGIISGTYLLVLAQDGPLQQSMKRGKEVYSANCASCHMPEGLGVEGAFPPLANTSYLKNQQRAIGIVVNGQEGEITVNGKKYNIPMAGLSHLTDQQVADVLNYVSNSWKNKNPLIKPGQVKALRK